MPSSTAAPPRRRTVWVGVSLVAVVAVGAVLRFSGLGAGIPYAIGVDEPQLVNRAVIMMKTGDFNPHFFDYPTLCIYLHLMVAVGRFLTGALAGRWTNLADFSTANAYLWARALTAVLGSATIVLVYQCAREWGRWPALFAAAMMSVMPLHVRESHYALTDVPMTFFVALTLLLSLRAQRYARFGAFAWAGIAAGLAGGCKYPGALAVLMPLTAAALRPDVISNRVRAAALAILCAGGTFLVVSPFVVLDLPAFLNGFARLAGMYAPTPGTSAWLTYLKHLRIALSWPGTLAAIVGLGIVCAQAIRGPRRVPARVALVFAAAFFLLLARQSGLVFGRYLLPLTPFICLFLAAVASSVRPALQRISSVQGRTAAAIALAAIVLAAPLVTCASFDRTISKPSTQALVYGWLTGHVASDQLVVAECADLELGYAAFRTERVRQLRFRTAADYAAEHVTYLVASSACYGPYLRNPRSDPDAYVAYTRLFAETQVAAVFEPSNDHPGPEYRVLKIRP